MTTTAVGHPVRSLVRVIAPTASNTTGIVAFFFGSFILCFVAAGLVSQVYSGIPPTMDYSPLDYFTGGGLWMAGAVCLLMAASHATRPLRLLFWLAGCVALATLAIDEFMGMHEKTREIVGDDDHSKVVLGAMMPVALYLIYRVERLPAAIGLLFVAGFALQSAYLVTDVGDGDYFTLPLPVTTLQWAEDILELLFVSTYLAAFLAILERRLRFGP